MLLKTRLLNIAFVNNRAQLGGAETVMQQLHRGCCERGHRSRIFVGENVERKVPPHVTHLYPRLLHRLFHSRFNGWIARYAPRRGWIDRALVGLGSGRYDVVHVHNFHGLYASTPALAALSRRIPVVWTFHRFWGVTGGCDHPGDCRRYLEACGSCPRVNEWPICGVENTAEQLAEKKRLLGSSPLVIVAPSEHLARVVRQSPVGRGWRVEVIRNGVDATEFQPFDGDVRAARQAAGLSPAKAIVLAVNRSFSDPLKGGAISADAIARLDFDKCQVVVVGGETAELQSRVGPRADCIFTGYLGDRRKLAELLQLADVFLYASPRENFPCATLEAMASGCCVVSTPTDGVLEQIEDGREGLFATDFSGEALAAAASRVIAQLDRARELAAAARQRLIREFSEAVMVERHLALYQQLVGAR